MCVLSEILLNNNNNNYNTEWSYEILKKELNERLELTRQSYITYVYILIRLTSK